MATFIAVYSGKTVSEAELLAITADPNVVQLVAQALDLEEQASIKAAQREVRGNLSKILDEVERLSEE